MRPLSQTLIAAALILTPAIAQATAPAPVQAGAYNVEPSHTRVQFAVSHMGFSDWYGDFTGVTGTLSLDPKAVGPKAVNGSKVDITIPVASVSTTNTTLDGELKSKDWLDAGQFATIRFVSTGVKQTGARSALISGNLTLHGVTKPVVLKASFNGSGVNPLSKGYTVGFNATTSILRSAYGVKTYLPLIGDAVTIRISAAFEKAQ